MNSKLATKGFTLVEVLVSIFLVTLFILGFSQVLGIYLKSQKDLDYSERKQEIIISVINLINNDVAWQKTIDQAANTSLDCLKDPGKFPGVANAGACTLADGGKFSLLDDSGNIFIDYPTASSGMSLSSWSCNTFSLSGDDTCPMRVELSWRPLCVTCANNQIEITIELRDSPLNRKSIQAALTSRKVIRYAQPYDPDIILSLKMDGVLGSSVLVGAPVKDFSGFKNNGVLSGSASAPLVSYAAGKIGQGMQFQTDKYVLIADAESVRPAGPITVTAWVNVGAALTTYNGIVSKRISGGGHSYVLRAASTGFSFCVAENSGSRCVNSGAAITTGTWYYLAGTWDMANIKLFVNGALAAGPLAYVGPNYWTNEDLLIGAENQSGTLSFFPGIIDQVKIWKRALKPTEILSQYNNL